MVEAPNEAREGVSPCIDVGAYLRLDRGWPEGELTDRRLREYPTLGMSELHLYHLGLLGQQGLATLRAIIDKTKALGVAGMTRHKIPEFVEGPTW